MELRHLRYFVAVAEELHFRRAAERLYVAQPAVSEQVRKLEVELGVRLFDRTQRAVSLTPAGCALLEEARRVLRQAEAAQEAARTAGDRATMRLRIGHLADALPESVPRALTSLTASAPRIEVDLATAPAQRLLDDLRAERLDVAITTLPAAVNGLRVTPLDEQRAVAVLPASHPAAAHQRIALARLAPERIVVLARDTDPPFHDTAVALCRSAGLSPGFVTIAEPRLEHVMLSVAAGAGIGLVPDPGAGRSLMPGVRMVALEDRGAAVAGAALTRHDTESFATAAFLRALARAARRCGEERSVAVAAAPVARVA
jgi:DNA-binding transcriptional LysR family regulator